MTNPWSIVFHTYGVRPWPNPGYPQEPDDPFTDMAGHEKKSLQRLAAADHLLTTTNLSNLEIAKRIGVSERQMTRYVNVLGMKGR